MMSGQDGQRQCTFGSEDLSLPDQGKDFDSKFSQYLQLYEKRKIITLCPKTAPLCRPSPASNPAPLPPSQPLRPPSPEKQRQARPVCVSRTVPVRPLGQSDLNSKLQQLRSKYDIKQEVANISATPSSQRLDYKAPDSYRSALDSRAELSYRDCSSQRYGLSRQNPVPLNLDQLRRKYNKDALNPSRVQQERASSQFRPAVRQSAATPSAGQENGGPGQRRPSKAQMLQSLMKIQVRIGQMVRQSRS